MLVFVINWNGQIGENISVRISSEGVPNDAEPEVFKNLEGYPKIRTEKPLSLMIRITPVR